MKVGYAESLFANWSFLPRIFSRFGKINKDMGKKKKKSIEQLRPYMVVRGIESGKDLNPNYLCLQQTRSMFSRIVILIA